MSTFAKIENRETDCLGPAICILRPTNCWEIAEQSNHVFLLGTALLGFEETVETEKLAVGLNEARQIKGREVLVELRATFLRVLKTSHSVGSASSVSSEEKIVSSGVCPSSS